MYLEFRPESFDGIILLTGERDDLTGDFMAVLIHQGFIEFWYVVCSVCAVWIIIYLKPMCECVFVCKR